MEYFSEPGNVLKIELENGDILNVKAFSLRGGVGIYSSLLHIVLNLGCSL